MTLQKSLYRGNKCYKICVFIHRKKKRPLGYFGRECLLKRNILLSRFSTILYYFFPFEIHESEMKSFLFMASRLLSSLLQ